MSLRRWSISLSAAGLLVSLYLTLVRYSDGQIPLVCPNAGFINCEEVLSSAESSVGTLPVALLGVLFFSVSLVLETLRRVRLQLAWTAIGLAFVFYLVYVGMFLIGALCVWCTVVQVIVAAIFLIAVAESTAEPLALRPPTNGRTSHRRRPASGH